MDPVIAGELLLIAFLVVCSCYFSGVETTMLSLPRQRVHAWSQQPSLMGRAFRKWQEQPNRILTAILIGNNAVNITASVIAAYLAIHMAEANGWSRAWAGTVTSAAVTATIIVFGEIIPKVTARAKAVALAPWIILPICVFEILLSPLTRAVAAALRRLAPRLASAELSTATEEDVKLILEMGRRDGTFAEDETRMIHSIFRFSDKRVREVMVPRTDMVGVEVSMNLDLILDVAIQSGYSRLPVFRGSADNVVGVLYTHDLLSIWRNRDLIVLQDLLRKPVFVPTTMRVDRLLAEFRRGKMHMAVVVDEYGGTAGLVTLEDLVTEIIGDISDEKTGLEDEGPVVRQSDGSFLVDPATPLEEVNSALGLHLAARGEVASLGGYIVDRMGRLPRKGRVFDDAEAALHVMDADERSILKVRVVKREKPLELKPASERKVRKRRERKAPEAPPATETSAPPPPG
jgi:putative hemolysin